MARATINGKKNISEKRRKINHDIFESVIDNASLFATLHWKKTPQLHFNTYELI